MTKSVWIVALATFGVGGALATADTGVLVTEAEAQSLVDVRKKARRATVAEAAEFAEAAYLAQIEAAEAEEAEQADDDAEDGDDTDTPTEPAAKPAGNEKAKP